MTIHTPIQRTLLLLLPLLLLAGCGFHLRGNGPLDSDLPAALSPLYIQGLARDDALYRAIGSQLQAGGAQLTDDPAAAASRLQVSNRDSQRRVVAVDGQGKVLEYQLSERLSFSLQDAHGNQLVQPQSVSAVQSYFNPETEVLGKQSEEENLRQDMYRRIGSQILRRLTAQTR